MLLYGRPDRSTASRGEEEVSRGPIPREGAAMIKQAEKSYAPLEVERQVQEFWSRTKAYQKTVAAREKGEDFYFGDGPPFTTGSIHLGQVLNKTIKDLVVRYHRMRGYHVRDQPGYDMHGLPIEVQVEKTLGITNKKEIEELGIEKFVNTCRTFATDLLQKMTKQFQSLGIWLDWDHPYMTIRNEFIEAAWWTLKHAHEREWIYEALRSIQWCSRCETALADAEVEYAEETDPSIYVKFSVARKPNESLLNWTTTPWTLPANLAIAVHPDFQYAKVKVPHGKKSEYIWVMESAVPDTMARGGVTKYSVVETKKGSDLVGFAYLHPLRTKLPYQKGVEGKWVHKVVPSETVVAEYTGLVHSAPGHGPEDFELGQKLGLPAFSPVDARGHFTDDAGAYAGQSVREANPRIVADLRAAHALFAEETIVHAYGHCWRCKTPILFRATVQWFLKVADVKPKMVEEVGRVTWFPDWAGSARQLDWTSNLRDWCISRQRYWASRSRSGGASSARIGRSSDRPTPCGRQRATWTEWTSTGPASTGSSCRARSATARCGECPTRSTYGSTAGSRAGRASAIRPARTSSAAGGPRIGSSKARIRPAVGSTRNSRPAWLRSTGPRTTRSSCTAG